MKTEPRLQYQKWWKTVHYVIAILLAMLTVIPPNSYATSTYVLGNKASWAPGFGAGPSGDGSITLTYPSNPTVIFSRSDTLTPANVVLNWRDGYGSANGGDGLYCTQAETGSGGPLSVESGFVSAGTYGGMNIFKTNITGLYFSINLRSFSTNNEATTNISSLDIQDGVMHSVLQLTTNSSSKCKDTNTTGTVNYYTRGGLAFYSKLTFYTDQTYTPSSTPISLLKTGDFHIRIWNETPGTNIDSHYMNITFDISGVVVSEPTCTTQPVASGSSVSGTTVDLGSYSPNDIIKGVSAVPFSIKLAGCKGLRNINVTLTSTTVASSPTLLGNILTSNHATGVGVEISGAANNYSSQMVMIPNDTTSVYNDQRDTSSDDNIYGSGESGQTQSQTLNFLATLKRDGNQKIEGGNFKANGIFTFDYP
ncbi:fimbrial protein [Salmonella bongori]|uniref:fimbrial protein n=1 Tax=Salmonella bongori TaxID=54736 RepID=UPI0009AAC888|nr:fimbrial protein [Salmonella bongori]